MNEIGITSQETRDQFLSLLVTQLQHQDPLEPVKQEDFLQQLAQFSTLEGVEQLNARFEDMLKLQELTEGASLIGKQAVYTLDDGSASQPAVVDAVNVSGDRLLVSIGSSEVPIERIQSLVAGSAGPAGP